MADFPSYGELLLNGYGEDPQGAVDRTEMESGPPKQGMVRSRQLIVRPVTFRVTSTQFASFKTWFRDSIARGASWFNWDDPLDGATKLARIQRGEYSARVYNPGDGELKVDVSFQLETWDD